jgi:O-antigen/teichoic acid export membrane protein
MDSEENKQDVFSISIRIILTSIVFVLIGGLFIDKVSLKLSEYWLYFVVYYIVYILQDNSAQFIKGLGYTGEYAIQGVIQTIILVSANIVFLLVLHMELEGFLLATILGYSSATVYMFFKCRLYLFYKKGIDYNLARRMLVYSLPMVPTAIGWWLNGSLDKYLLIALIGYSANGVYSVAQKIPSILTVIISIFTQAWVLSVISSYGDKDFSKYYIRVHDVFLGVGTIGCASIIILSKVLGQLLFAKDFFQAWMYVPILTVATLLSSYSIFLSSVFRAAKRTKSIFISTIIGSLVNLILNLLLIPRIGCIGAAIATVIGFAIMCFMRIIEMSKFISLEYSMIRLVAELLLLFGMAIIVSLELSYSWIIASGIFVIIIIINKKTLKYLIKQGKTILYSILKRG